MCYILFVFLLWIMIISIAGKGWSPLANASTLFVSISLVINWYSTIVFIKIRRKEKRDFRQNVSLCSVGYVWLSLWRKQLGCHSISALSLSFKLGESNQATNATWSLWTIYIYISTYNIYILYFLVSSIHIYSSLLHWQCRKFAFDWL